VLFNVVRELQLSLMLFAFPWHGMLIRNESSLSNWVLLEQRWQEKYTEAIGKGRRNDKMMLPRVKLPPIFNSSTGAGILRSQNNLMNGGIVGDYLSPSGWNTSSTHIVRNSGVVRDGFIIT